MSQHIELSVGGMTCASCQRRVEKALTKIDGVSASVNYATGTAVVDSEKQIDPAQLIQVIENVGYTASLTEKAQEKYGVREFLIRLAFSSVFTIPLMAIAMIPAAQFKYWQWVCAALATPVVTWAAWPFHRAAFLNLKHRSVTMDTLVSMGVSVSYLWSFYAILFTHAGNPDMKMSASLFGSTSGHEVGIYFEVAAAVTTLVILGKYLEHRARDRSTQALENLATLNPKSALIIRDGKQVSIPIEEVKVGDELYVQTGSQIPVDSVVINGTGHIDKSLVTGESMPVEVTAGDSVIGATVLLDGALTVRAIAVGKDTVLAGISRLVHQAQTGKAEVTKLVDRVSEIFVPLVIGLSLLTGLYWLLIGNNPSTALTTSIAVLVIACPCALGLATPTALLVGTGRGAALGLLIRGPHAIESSRRIDRIFIDKTGTLTDGHMSVSDVVSTISDKELWETIDALEASSLHPIATSLRKHAHSLGFTHSPAEKIQSVSGSGVQGLVDGNPCTLGSVNWLGLPDGDLKNASEKFAAQGDGVVVLYKDAYAVAVIALSDQIAKTTKDAITKLEQMNIEPIVLSGDHEGAVKKVCDQLGIKNFYANSSPQYKLDQISKLQQEGHFVAMVGDGVNDAAALAKAHLSLAMGAGADVAASAADIVLMRSSMAAAVDAIALSRATMRTIRANLFWAFGYNVAAIPLAMSGLLSPVIASGAMAFSSVFVVTNSLRLRKFKALS
jgi:P-type Cu+ transporter